MSVASIILVATVVGIFIGIYLWTRAGRATIGP
jgi:hypothetical protein